MKMLKNVNCEKQKRAGFPALLYNRNRSVYCTAIWITLLPAVLIAFIK